MCSRARRTAPRTNQAWIRVSRRCCRDWVRHRHLATTRDTYRMRAFADSAAWGAFVF